MKIQDNVKEFATVAFTLLGILFGMMIMTFIFGQLGSSATATQTDDTIIKVNVTGAFLNLTGYTIAEASRNDFNGGVAITEAINATSGEILPTANYSVVAKTGVVTNGTNAEYADVNLTYSYLQKTDATLATEQVQNNSLESIVSYSNQSNTQFVTVAIAITLVVLIAVFLLFWKIFVGKKGGKGRKNKGSFM